MHDDEGVLVDMLVMSSRHPFIRPSMVDWCSTFRRDVFRVALHGRVTMKLEKLLLFLLTAFIILVIAVSLQKAAH